MRLKLILIFFICLYVELYSQAKEKFTFATHWLPQAQFAGYYAAIHNNIYGKYGLDVEITHAGPNMTAEDLLSEGKVMAASMFLSTALIQRSYNKDFINIGQLSQRSAQLFVAKKTSGIFEPKDIDHKKVGIWKSGFDEIPTAFLMRYNLNVEIVPIASTVSLFMLGGIDIMTTMWYNEYHTIINSGLDESELTTFFFSDYDLNIPEDGIYCMKEAYDKNPELFKKFISATLDGWAFVFNHKTEVLDLVLLEMKKMNVPANRAHQAWMLDRMQDIFMRTNQNILSGELSENDYKKAVNLLIEIGKIKSAPNYNNFYYGDVK